MMKLKFEDVLEYVAAGADDPEMERWIELDPDGPELLRQAKRMHEMLGRLKDEPENPDADDLSPETVSLQASERLAEPEAAYEYSEVDLFGDRTEDQSSVEDIKSLSQLVRRAAGPRRGIGVLTVQFEGERAELSHEDERPAPRRGMDFDKFTAKRPKSVTYLQSMRQTKQVVEAGVVIQGIGITIGLPEAMSAALLFRLHIVDNRLRIPARGLEVTFMPESGPFVRAATDSKGLAEFDMPQESGVLRIETNPPQFLDIRLRR